MNDDRTILAVSKSQRERLDKTIAEAESLASTLEKESRSQVRTSILFDIVTVLFGVASPALTTFVAYNQGHQYLNLSMILVVSLAVSLPTMKRLLGIKKKAIHFSAGAFDLRGAVSKVHDEIRRTDEDVKDEKKPKYYEDQDKYLRGRISDVRQRLNALTFDIMEEASVEAEKRASQMEKKANKGVERTDDPRGGSSSAHP